MHDRMPTSKEDLAVPLLAVGETEHSAPDMGNESSACAWCIEARYNAVKRKVNGSAPARQLVSFAGVAWSLVKVAWAIYLSVVVSGYYHKIKQMEAQVAVMQQHVVDAQSDLERSSVSPPRWRGTRPRSA